MREILFRGQTRRKGEKVYVGTGKPVDSNWVYGGIFQGTGDFSIIYSYEPIEKHTVYTDTIGQFTGLTDKNDKKIFEGDIVKFTAIPFGYSNIGVVCFNAGSFCIKYLWHSLEKVHRIGQVDEWQDMGASGEITYNYEVIGNIHDNPELLEV